MCNELEIMEDLDKFFEERENREKMFKLVIELKTSDIDYLSPSFVFSEPKKKMQKKVKIHTSRKREESDLF
jgi:hypothetical protein